MAAVEVPEREAALVRRTVSSFAAPGTWLTGAERHAIATRSRALRSDEARQPDDDVGHDDLVWRLTSAPHTIRPAWIDSLSERGVSPLTYVEVLGIVARLQAIDTFAFALGSPPAELPLIDTGSPSRDTEPAAEVDGGWVPTVGRASPPNALSAVPAEHRAMHDVHDVFYLSIAEMSDLDANRGLHRTQMELVAARTSLLNECFY